MPQRTRPAPPAIASVDLFCRVVDNFGDAGVCLRLARQLVLEHGVAVRLWIDDPATLERLIAADAGVAALIAAGRLGVARWQAPVIGAEASAPIAVADLAIETFGCDLPEEYAQALAARAPPARWYNLEYLSAEDWVAGCQGLPSPHPRLPVARCFFFPGFTPDTGGLLREAGLLGCRRAFQHARPRDPAGALEVALFCYPDAPVASLLDAFEQGPSPVRCRVFQGGAQAAAQAWSAAHPGHRTGLDWQPWLSQQDFDRVLWSSDFNLVRGEDSFVRAQWAGRPFAWDIYPQSDGAHLVKMAAFLRRYRGALGAPEPAQALGAFWQAWVRREGGDLAAAWRALVPCLPALRAHAEDWCEHLAALPDLATALLEHARAH